MDFDDIDFPNISFISSHNRFYHKYRVRSVSMLLNRTSMESGGRILMPSSSLRYLSELGIETPWFFRIKNILNNKSTYCGVLEFTAEEGRIYVPTQFMKNLELISGQSVEVISVELPVAKYAKFEPQSVDFLEISNPRALLENCLRNHACLTVNDIISITYGEKTYLLKIISLGKDVEAAKIIDCDIIVEFDPPLGYVEETVESRQKRMIDESNMKIKEKSIDVANKLNYIKKTFKGQGERGDGKKKKNVSNNTMDNDKIPTGIPDYDYKFGEIKFIRKESNNIVSDVNSSDKFIPFKNKGSKLKDDN